MTHDAKTEKLVEVIERGISETPFEFEGFKWAVADQRELAGHLGWSLATLQRRIAKPPFVRDYTHVRGAKRLLLRVGEPGPKTARHKANILQCIMRKAGYKTHPKQYWGLRAWAEMDWPDDLCFAIFRTVIAKGNWPEFCAGAKLDDELAADVTAIAAGDEPFQDVVHRSYKFPAPHHIANHPRAALEFYVMKMQEGRKLLPPSLAYLNPVKGVS